MTTVGRSVRPTTAILRIAVRSPLRRCFDYLAPARADPAQLHPGSRVRVPFGRGRRIGVLLEVRDDSPMPRDTLRTVIEILDTDPVLPSDLVTLAAWTHRYYHHPPGDVFAALLPALLRQGRDAGDLRAPLWRITDAGRQALHDGALARAHRQRALLHYLADRENGVPGDELRRDTASSSASARRLLQLGLAETFESAPQQTMTTSTPPRLTAGQAAAVTAARAAFGRFEPFLLDGITGSGKTEVYLQIVETALERGRGALVLVPEIGLTPQLVARFQARLPGPLAVLHSGLSDRERLDAWRRARDGGARVVLGTRSAVFAPLPALGVIIVDEEHDLSFKQQDGLRYNARNLAVVRARQAGVPVILGSATPSLESLYNAQAGRYQRLRLRERVGNARLPRIQLLDLRRQTMYDGLSAPLLVDMRSRLARGEQVLLFLNRRGFAPTLICHECGWICQCARCDARMTLHVRHNRLLCHHCGAEQTVPVGCYNCGSVDLRAVGQGTERIEQVLEREFPDVGIARMDRDSTRRKGSLQTLLKLIRTGERRILIGTQMLAKGHHFPNVSLVGIVDADQGLFGADFRASERMAQLITQVSGRAGRADKPGLVLVQTHFPDHPLLRTLVTGGYHAFAAAALEERAQARLPPFSWQALLRADATQQAPPQAFLEEALALGIQSRPAGVELLGPVPASMERRAGRYRAQLLVQARRRSQLHRFLGRWVADLEGLKAGRQVRWSLDVDPEDIF